MTLAGEERTRAKAPGKIGFERGDPGLVRPLMPTRTVGETVDLADVARGPSAPAARATPGTCAPHQSIAPCPSATTPGRALSPSQNGASIPPASHDALPPSSDDRSMSATVAPRSARVSAVVKPTTPAPTTVARIFSLRRIDVERPALLDKLARLFRHAGHCFGLPTQVLGDLHRAEFRPAHRAEMRDLVAVLRQRLIVELARGVGIERQVELVLPAEVEPGPRKRIVVKACGRVALGEIGGMGRDSIGDDACLYVLAVGQTRDALSGSRSRASRAVPADHRRPNRGSNVVVAGGDVGSQRPQGIERRFAALL